ncbi:MAG TPA: nuclear transport factor 2 family protein [Candidatus Dormibacteraeota bacterium]|nr:nuclear transport factor 2 family protein [Candidatus Dormibacteraeota bacterium]
METQSQAPAGIAAVERLEGAINSHDIDQLVACFAPDFVSRQPAHPSRDFTGREQVRQNWAMIFAGVPDLRAKLVRSALSGDTAWAEWEWSGTRRDGQPHEMRGVTVQGISGDQLAWVNFYMEMVDVAGADVMTSIREMTK